MDLGAYAQIEDLEQVMKDNNIDVPRLRGLRLMKQEEPISKAAMEDHWEWIGVNACESLCQNGFVMSEYSIYELSERTDRYELRKAKERVLKQDNMFNKYCGRDDVLYIHARLGGGNWNYYNCDEIIKNQPWYLEHCEDAFDCTYVDIYAKIKEVE